MNRLTEDQIAQLAPDAASLKAGRELANERKWLICKYNSRVLWGEVQGSGNTPYRTQIDLQATAFKCSCPSRKFPCKHGLGLLFLWTAKSGALKETAQEPDWVNGWIEKRHSGAQAGGETLNDAPSDATNPATDNTADDKRAKDKAKREDERLLSVQAGAAELELLLRDLLRAGLHTIPEKGADFFEKSIRRMVDAKAPGLGNLLRNFNKINYFNGYEWHADVLENAAKTWLLLEAFKRVDQLPGPVQDDVRSLMGWNKRKEEVLQNPEAKRVEDDWLVLGKIIEQEDELLICRQWLYACRSNCYALLLDFVHKNASPPLIAVPGGVIRAEFVYYPSNYPLRALINTPEPVLQQAPEGLAPLVNWAAAQRQLADSLAASPWLDDFPQFVGNLRLVSDGTAWFLQDAEEAILPVHASYGEDKIYQLLALSGGWPMDLFLLRSGQKVMPLLLAKVNVD